MHHPQTTIPTKSSRKRAWANTLFVTLAIILLQIATGWWLLDPITQVSGPSFHFEDVEVARRKASENEEATSIVIFSNRYLGLAMTISSLCHSLEKDMNLVDDQRLRIYIFTDPSVGLPDNLGSSMLRHCPQTTQMEFVSIHHFMDDLKKDGFDLPWRHEPSKAEMEEPWAVETPYTDNKHASPMNLLRFYLPHYKPFSAIEKIIFLDDDLVIQKDIRALWNYPLLPNISMGTGCQHWTWVGPDQHASSTNMTVRETGYIGAHSIPCRPGIVADGGPCTRPNLEHDLVGLSRKLNPESALADRPLDRRAFDMGFSIVNLNTWKDQKITETFERWALEVYNRRLFRPNSLAFGLGLGYFSIADSFQCYEDDSNISHLVGLAFVNDDSRKAEGWDMDKIAHDAVALHYNGGNKPWLLEMPECKDSTSANPLLFPSTTDELWQSTCLDMGICKCRQPSGTRDGSVTSGQDTPEGAAVGSTSKPERSTVRKSLLRGVLSPVLSKEREDMEPFDEEWLLPFSSSKVQERILKPKKCDNEYANCGKSNKTAKSIKEPSVKSSTKKTATKSPKPEEESKKASKSKAKKTMVV